MTDAVPSEPTGQAPATPGASPPETPQAQEGTILTGNPPVDAAKPAIDPAKPAEPAAPVIPDKYEFKPLDGMELDVELLDGMTPVLKKLGMTQESASELVDGFNEVVGKLNVAREAKAEADFKAFMADKAKEHRAAMQKEWGNNYAANEAISQRGFARFLGKEGAQLLEETGLGNHPLLVKAFYQAGKMIQEDTPPANVTPTVNGSSKLFTKSLGVN